MNLRHRAYSPCLATVLLFTIGATEPLHAKNTGVPSDVPVTSSEIVVDGDLSEAAWTEALQLKIAYEVRPAENATPPVATDVLLTYDKEHLFVGFRANDPDPRRIRARYRDRDNAWNDDFVGVVLDTFNDERRAYELMVNPLGVQMDAINNEVEGRYDTAWDAIWTSAGRITDDGFEVEIAIPFKQLRFQPNSEAQTWGFDAIRSYPRGTRHHLGTFARDRGQNSYLSQAVKIRGFAAIQQGRNLQVVPTATGSRVDTRDNTGNLKKASEDADLGLTARWGVTPNWVVSGTVNPDFSQVEADVLQLEVNQQFALFFRETRPFFLEGADTFTTPLNLVYTRTITDPAAALKAIGKQGRHTIGVFTARDDVTNVLVPGSEFSQSGSFASEATATVARYRYDLGENSTVGVLLTDRSSGEYGNQVGAADLRWRPTEQDSFRLQTGFSATRYSGEMQTQFDLPDESIDGHAIEAGYSHSRRSWNANVNYSDVDETFRADVGFIPQVNRREVNADSGYIWHGEDQDWYNSLSSGGWVYRAERQNGDFLLGGVGGFIDGQFDREISARVWVVDERRRFGGTDFDLTFVGFRFSSRPWSWLGLNARGEFGDWVDFAGVRPADRENFRVQANVSLGRSFDSRFAYNYSTLRLAQGRLLTARAPELRLIYYVNQRLYFRLISQYTEVERSVELSSFATAPREQDLLTQILGVYELNPQTAVYIGYGDEWDDRGFAIEGTMPNELSPTLPPDLERQTRAFFLKVGYAWQP